MEAIYILKGVMSLDMLSLVILRLLQDNPHLMCFKDIQNITGQSDKKVKLALDDIRTFATHHQGDLRMDGSNYYLYPTETNFVRKITNLDFYTYRLTKIERLMLEFFLSTMSRKPITMQDLSDILGVSRSTIHLDLKELVDILSQYDIHLLGYTGIGLHVSGNASDISKLLIRYIGMNRFIFDILLHSEILATYFPDIETIRSSTEQAVKLAQVDSNHFLVDKSEQSLVIFLIWWRYWHRSLAIDSKGTVQPTEFIVNIGKYLDISKEECEELSQNDLTSFDNIINDPDKVGDVADDIVIQVIVMEFIEKVSKKLSVPLGEDFDLFQNMTRHIQSLLADEFQVNEIGGTLQFIYREYPEIQEAVRGELEMFNCLFKRALSDEEQALILVYVCASMEKFYYRCQQQTVLIVCNAGVGIGRLLQTRLESRFQFNVVGWVGKNQLDQMSQLTYDFIISTVPLEIATPYVLISSLLTPNDIARINQMMCEVYLKHRHSNESRCASLGQKSQVLLPSTGDHTSLLDLLTRDRIQLDVEASNWSEAVYLAAQPLLTDGTIEECYVTAMISNIKLHGPYMMLGDRTLLPHAELGKGSNELAFSFTRLSKPLYLEGDLDKAIEFIFVLSAVDADSHLPALFQLNYLLKDVAFLKGLHDARKPHDVISLLSCSSKDWAK